MNVIIPVGGYATRLYPLTENQPKALLTVGDKPILEHIVKNIETLPSVQQVILVSNDKFYKAFVAWSQQVASSVDIKVLNDGTLTNEDRLGAVGDIQFAIDALGLDDQELLILAGDNVFPDALSDLYNTYKKNNGSMVACIDVKDKAIASRMGIVAIDSENKITSFVEKPKDPPSTLAAAMIYFIKADHVKYVSSVLAQSNNDGEINAGEFIAHLSSQENVYTSTLSAWFDIGNHEQLKKAHQQCLTNPRSIVVA